MSTNIDTNQTFSDSNSLNSLFCHMVVFQGVDFLLATSAVAVWQNLFCCLAAVTNTAVCGWWKEMVYASRVSHWPDTWVSLIHFDSTTCNIFRQLNYTLVRHALAVIIWFTISTIFTYNVHGKREILSSWDVSGISYWNASDQRKKSQLKGGSAAHETSVLLWCVLAWEKNWNLSDISKSSQKRLVSIIFLVILFYSLPLEIHQDASRDVLFAAQYGLRRLRWLSSCWWCVGTKNQVSWWVCCQTLSINVNNCIILHNYTIRNCALAVSQATTMRINACNHVSCM